MAILNWRHMLLMAVPVIVLGALFSVPAIPQPLEYHLFADVRGGLGIPNFGDVTSNLAFLVVGGLGLYRCLTARPEGARFAWIVFFAGAALVSAGSAYYHWQPDNPALVWDRLPMTIGFMGAYVALVSEHAGKRLEALLILPAIAVGLASVIYWGFVDDLRFYLAVQGTVFATIIVLIAAFPHRPGQRGLMASALAIYGLAVICEQLDRQIYDALAGLASGHTIKHLLAAIAVFVIARMVYTRPSTRPLPADAVA